MKRRLAIIFQIFLICALFTTAWGQTNFERCFKAYNAKDYINAYPACKESAKQGSANAQYLLGVMYKKGEGVRQDFVEAAIWERKAAEKGNVDAQLILGSMYYFGMGVKEDYAEAAIWYGKAAEQGNAKAQLELAERYFYGEGVRQDYSAALMWYRKAAEQGNANAQFSLGRMYEKGMGVKQDFAEAFMWYGNAAKQGNEKAQAVLSESDFRPDLLKVWAEADDSDSQFELAEKYISGAGVEKNRYLAEKWLVNSILNDPKNKKSIELIEKEFNWHCVDGDFCTSIINNASIIHDKNLSWYWKIGLMKVEMNKEVMRVTLKNYDVMNCNNRTLGHKTLQALDSDLNPKENVTIADNKIEFKPLEPSAHSGYIYR
jgi:hypothetical protein